MNVIKSIKFLPNTSGVGYVQDMAVVATLTDGSKKVIITVSASEYRKKGACVITLIGADPQSAYNALMWDLYYCMGYGHE